jgi:hypothetical protein
MSFQTQSGPVLYSRGGLWKSFRAAAESGSDAAVVVRSVAATAAPRSNSRLSRFIPNFLSFPSQPFEHVDGDLSGGTDAA